MAGHQWRYGRVQLCATLRRLCVLSRATVQRLAVGSALPTLPLWLDAVTYVRLDLEATYTDTCRRRRIPA